MTATAPTLIEGHWYHDQGQGTKVHLLRTLVGETEHVATLCGQVWLLASIRERTAMDAMKDGRNRWLCKRCFRVHH